MLRRIVGDTQLLGGGSPDLIEDHGERLGGAKIPQTTAKLDRDVCQDGRGDARSRSMRYAGLWAVGFAAGSFARAAPSGALELELRIWSRHSCIGISCPIDQVHFQVIFGTDFIPSPTRSTTIDSRPVGCYIRSTERTAMSGSTGDLERWSTQTSRVHTDS